MDKSIRALSKLNRNETPAADISVSEAAKPSLDDLPVGSLGSDRRFKVLLCFQWLPKKLQKGLEMRRLTNDYQSERVFTMTVCRMVNSPLVGGAGNSRFKPVLKVTMLPEKQSWMSEQGGADVSNLYDPFEYYTDSLKGKSIVIEVYNQKITRHGKVYGTVKIEGDDLLECKGNRPVQKWFSFDGNDENCV